MRAVYKNPKELATCLKDLVDSYFEGLVSEDKLNQKVLKMIDANRDAIYDANGFMPVKLASYLGDERKAIIDNILKSR